MAVQGSGQISKQDVVDEFGGTAPHAMSEYYRGAGEVGSANTNVPTSGEIKMSDFYGSQDAIVHNISSNATNQDVQSLFGNSDYQGSETKLLTIPSGVSIGGSGFGTGNIGLTVPSGLGGSLIIQNAGTISGAGGSGGGGGAGASPHPTTGSAAGSPGGSGSAGSPAIKILTNNVTVTNTGTINGGGGGGGGGSGGFSPERGGGPGGVGGSGGRGFGHDGSEQAGSGGGGGGIRPGYPHRAGTPGATGGTGGAAGQAGDDGGSIGASGGSGGAAGNAVLLGGGISYTLNNTGTVNGSS
tara:strand:- start:579 stop:1472 length:894 start_codon:yes stop_codon:yes gene_type:complete